MKSLIITPPISDKYLQYSTLLEKELASYQVALTRQVKYLNACCQFSYFKVMNLNSYQIEWLCRHLGHSTNVHKSYYRHMSGFVERVKLSKLFLVQDMNLMSQYKDKNLDDIDLQGTIDCLS